MIAHLCIQNFVEFLKLVPSLEIMGLNSVTILVIFVLMHNCF